MNIFFLDEDPVSCAKQHCDKHVVKMTTEYAQILSTALRYKYDARIYRGYWSNEECVFVGPTTLTPEETQALSNLYRATHVGHPSVKWASNTTKPNLGYVLDLFKATADEYTARYGKVHASYTKVYEPARFLFDKLSDDEFVHRAYNKDCSPYFFAPPQVVDLSCQVARGGKWRFGFRQHMLDYGIAATILAYRLYYIRFKKTFAKWSHSPTPEWFVTDTHEDLEERMKKCSTFLLPEQRINASYDRYKQLQVYKKESSERMRSLSDNIREYRRLVVSGGDHSLVRKHFLKASISKYEKTAFIRRRISEEQRNDSSNTVTPRFRTEDLATNEGFTLDPIGPITRP